MPLQASSAITVFTFTPTGGSAVQFNRMVEGGSGEPWFAATVSYTKDIPLGGSERPYLEVGGASFPELVCRAWFADATDRATIKNSVGLTGTLTTTAGNTASVVLVAAREVQLAFTAYVLDLTFEKVG